MIYCNIFSDNMMVRQLTLLGFNMIVPLYAISLALVIITSVRVYRVEVLR